MMMTIITTARIPPITPPAIPPVLLPPPPPSLPPLSPKDIDSYGQLLMYVCMYIAT